MGCSTRELYFIFFEKNMSMKKYLIIVALFVAGTLTTQAQLLPSIQLGLKGGLGFSNLKGENGDWLDASTRTGYQAGVWTRIGGAGFHVQPELYITGKSSEAKVVEGGIDRKGKMSFTSLDLPVLLGTRVGLGLAGLRIYAGPVVSFVFDKNISNTLKRVTDFDDYKNQQWAITGGVGLDVSRLRVDLRYEHGLTENKLRRIDGDAAPVTSTQKMNVWTVGVGYRLF